MSLFTTLRDDIQPVLAPLALLISIATLILTQLSRRQIRRDEGEKVLSEANRMLQEMSHPGVGSKSTNYGELQTAQMHASRALSLTRNAPRAQALMAVCHWLGGDKNAAEKELIRLAREHPKVHYSHCYLAALYLAYGQLDEAEVVLRRALETESACQTARSNQAILRFKQERFEEAADLWRAELALRPHDGVAHANLGAALADGGRHEEALTHFGLALQHGFRHADVYRNFGRVLVRMGKEARAEQMFQLAIELEPMDVFSLQALGFMRLSQSDKLGAKEYFVRGLAIDPTSSGCLEGLEGCA